MVAKFDPLDCTEQPSEWEKFEDSDCPSIDTVAQAETTDVDTLKKAIEQQLKQKGIEVGAFVVDGSTASFKPGTREEMLAARVEKAGSTMYVVADPDAASERRLMKVVKDEGMPTYKNPFIHGNLFLILKISFPESLSAEAQT